jgi:AcrR family transcriptional regulator
MAAGSRTKSRLTKAEQARQTRLRVIAAATTLFVRDGFLNATMAAIAGEAGVAVQTLYLSFGNKSAILKAAFDLALAGDDEPIPVAERPWVQETRDHPDALAALGIVVDGLTEIQRRTSPLYEVIRGAAADPEIGELLATEKRARHAGVALIAQLLSTKRGFDPKLSVDDATGVLYGVLSEDLYGLLVVEHGWTFERWRAWVLSTLSEQLITAKRRSSKRDKRRRRGVAVTAAAPLVSRRTDVGAVLAIKHAIPRPLVNSVLLLRIVLWSRECGEL